MTIASHIERSELFDLSDVLQKLNTLIASVHEHRLDITVVTPKRIKVLDCNLRGLGHFVYDGADDQYVFVPNAWVGP